jgi:hypothetical protein
MLHVLLMAAQLAAVDLTFAEAKAFADDYEAALNAKDCTTLVDAQTNALSVAIKACGPITHVLPPFTIVAHIDMSGQTDRIWRSEDSALAICLDEHLAAARLPAAVGKAFYASYELSFAP